MYIKKLFAVICFSTLGFAMPANATTSNASIYCLADKGGITSISHKLNNKLRIKASVLFPKAFIAFRFNDTEVAPSMKSKCKTSNLTASFVAQKLKSGAKAVFNVKLPISIDNKTYITNALMPFGFTKIDDELSNADKVYQSICGKPKSLKPNKAGLVALPLSGQCGANGLVLFYGYPRLQLEREKLGVERIECWAKKTPYRGRCVLTGYYSGWSIVILFPASLLPKWRSVSRAVTSNLNKRRVLSISHEGCLGDLCAKIQNAR